MSQPLKIVFDGSCRFCIRQMSWIRRRDRAALFEFIPSATPGLTDRFPMLASQDLSTGLRAITAEGSVRVGADAVYEIARRLPYWRHWVWLYRMPGLGALCRKLYSRIAARRYQLAGRCDESCAVPPNRNQS